MADKILITQTNGASAKEISDAIGQFLAQREQEEKKPEKAEEEE